MFYPTCLNQNVYIEILILVFYDVGQFLVWIFIYNVYRMAATKPAADVGQW